jgi:hypothetical protein
MATTTNYGWEKPTVGGDTNTWGGKLNTTLDDIDADLDAVDDRVDALEAGAAVHAGAVTGKTRTIHASQFSYVLGIASAYVAHIAADGTVQHGASSYIAPLVHRCPLDLPNGVVLQSVTVTLRPGSVPSTPVYTATLRRMSRSSGTVSDIATVGTSSGASMQDLTVSSLAHTIDLGSYWYYIDISQPASAGVGSYFRGAVLTYDVSDARETL